MSDLDHGFGGDLAIGPTGDLALVTGTVLGQQRVLRRLLTNAGDYIWHLGYGAGLAQAIGTPMDEAAIAGLVRQQIAAEAAVAADPPPQITLQPDGTILGLRIVYADARLGGSQSVAFTLGE